MQGLVRSTVIALALVCCALCRTASAAADAPAGKLIIVKAEYGDLDGDKPPLDVTAKVAAMIVDNSVSVVASDAVLGTAPPGGKQQLKVGYTLDGIYRSKTVDQGKTLDISTRLIILKALYGDLAGKRTADVTDQVADMVQKNRLSVDAGNDLFGDPAEGTPKQLRVEYTLDGVAKNATASEGQTLTIAPEKKS